MKMSRGKKTKKKEPRRRQDIEKRKEDKNEETHRGQPTPSHAEKLAHYFKSDELVELRNTVQSSDLSNVPLLLAAVMLGKFDVVKRLFKEGALIDCQGPEQTTPLMWAVKHKNMEMIDLLIRRGANIVLEDDRGDNAILLALQTSVWDQDSFLDFWNSVKDCEKFDLNHSNKSGYTMLHYATKNQWENVLNYLLSQGVNVNCVTSKGVTPLMMAASRNHNQFVRALLRARADVSIEDERCCTALCYTIAFVMQKHLELPNPTLEGLMNTIENCKSKLSLEMYLKRRLDVLLKPPDTGSNYADIISSIMHSIIVFFVRCTKTGLELLLEQQVFSRITEATEAHLDDPDYTHALLGLMLELLRYCSCCYGGGNCQFSEDQIMEIFFMSGGANICLSILKIYNNVVSNKWLLVAALMPLLSACPTKGKARAWLETHYKEIVPYYNNFLEMCLVKFNINADEYHLSLLRKKTRDFRKLMKKLEKGESIVLKEILKPPIEDIVRGTKQEIPPIKEENSIIEQANSVMEQENCVVQQVQSVNEQVISVVNENKISIPVLGNSIIEKKNSIHEQISTVTGIENSVAEQEIFYFDTNGNFCSTSCSQNGAVCNSSMDDVPEQEVMNVQSAASPVCILPEMPKIWNTENAKINSSELSFTLHDDCNESEKKSTHSSPDYLPLEVENESNTLSFTHDINENSPYDVECSDILEEDEDEEKVAFNNSLYSIKMPAKRYLSNKAEKEQTINAKIRDFSSNISNVHVVKETLNDKNRSYDKEATGDIYSIKATDEKEIKTLLKSIGNENSCSISSQKEVNEFLSNNAHLNSFTVKSPKEKKFDFPNNKILLPISYDSEEEKCENTGSITALDDLFKNLLIKYVKSWQYEYDNNYPGHCGGGDGFNTNRRMDKNFIELRPFLSKLEKGYIIYLKSIWESFREKLQETQNVDLYKEIANQVIELIRKHDKKLDEKIRHVDELILKHIQSENDYSTATLSSVESKETLCSIDRGHSVADSDELSEQMKGHMKKFNDDEYSFQNTLNSLSEVNFSSRSDEISEDRIGRCWETIPEAEDLIYNRQNLNSQRMSCIINKDRTPKMIVDSNDISSDVTSESNILPDDESDPTESIEILDLNEGIKIKDFSLAVADEKKFCNSYNCQSGHNFKSNEISGRKMSFAKLFKDNSVSPIANLQETILNNIMSSAHSTVNQSQALPSISLATLTNSDLGANISNHHLQFVPPPPGFPAQPLLSLESLLKIQEEVNNCQILQHAPPIPIYASLPDTIISPDKVAVFTTGRSSPPSSDITQLVPLSMIPGLPNYSSRWKFLIGILQNITPMYSHWYQDGLRMKRISLFDTPMKLPGGGNFGEVFCSLGDNRYPLATKVLYMNPSNASSTVGLLMQRMIAPLIKLKNENLLSYMYCGHHECRVFVISPLCECNLGEYLMCLKLHNKLQYRSLELVKQLTLGMNFLHTLPDPVIHGNLKPSNVLLDENGTLKLADFGLHPILYQINAPLSSSIIWWARETHDAYKQSNSLFCSLKSDIQVTGMMIHFIMTGGLHPFGAEADEIIDNVCKGKIKLKTASCEVNDVISWMMVFDPKCRPSILDIMSHVFFWDLSRKWIFVLGCCGIDHTGETLPLPLTEFHSTLDLKAMEDNVKGDWVSIVKPVFPDMILEENNSCDTPTGLLRFIRICVEEQQKDKENFNGPDNLQNFFLSAFPALTLSLFRLVEETEWRKHPVIANLLKGN